MLLLGDKRSAFTRPLVVLRDTTVFPLQNLSLTIGRPRSVEAITAAQHQNNEVIVVAQKNVADEQPAADNIYEVGTLVRVHQFLRTSTGQLQVQVEGVRRVQVIRILKSDPYLLAEAIFVPEEEDRTIPVEALRRRLLETFQQHVLASRPVSGELTLGIFQVQNLHRLVDMMTMVINPPLADRQAIMEAVNLKDRMELLLTLVDREAEIHKLSQKIQNRTEEELGKMQKEVFLREQMKSIQKELGNGDDEFGDLDKQIHKAGMPEATEKHALKELDRLRKMPSFGPEVSYVRVYLDVLVALPWKTQDNSTIDLKAAKRLLEQEHFGLDKVKERILEYLAVQKLTKGKTRAQILCFVGPPGVGKTSIGKSIAKALGRKFVRFSLGGMRDEAEIRGHRRTYVGAMPGRLIQSLKSAGTKNPVIMLDELDKIGADFRGDPAAALLEVLDPEQNSAFSDHYLEVPFDLSEVFFIATANVLDTIPPALRDRLEVIVYPGYTEEEKYHIAKDHLLSKVMQSHGLKKSDFNLSAEALRSIIRYYTREAGVRNLERQLAALARKIARRIEEGKWRAQTISERTLDRFLGPQRFRIQGKEEVDELGVVQGLAVTEAGGDVLTVEVTRMPGKSNLSLTGQLGDVMKESAQAAMSYARTRAAKEQLDQKIFSESDWHVHVPAGAIPKDGPSAGVAMATAIYSVAANRPVRSDVAMTGEVTLRGRVLEIGGVKEKVLAAHRAGMSEIILPIDNKKDLEEIPKNVRKDLKFTFARTMDDVLPVALTN